MELQNHYSDLKLYRPLSTHIITRMHTNRERTSLSDFTHKNCVNYNTGHWNWLY